MAIVVRCECKDFVAFVFVLVEHADVPHLCTAQQTAFGHDNGGDSLKTLESLQLPMTVHPFDLKNVITLQLHLVEVRLSV